MHDPITCAGVLYAAEFDKMSINLNINNDWAVDTLGWGGRTQAATVELTERAGDEGGEQWSAVLLIAQADISRHYNVGIAS